MRLKAKVAIVTGAGQGIGAATALKFAREGAVVAVCDLNAEAVARVEGACRKAGAQAHGYALDVANRESVVRMVADMAARHGRIDVLVNNAGITRDARLQKMTLKQFDDVIDVNLRAVFNTTQAVADIMVEQGAGVVLVLENGKERFFIWASLRKFIQMELSEPANREPELPFPPLAKPNAVKV